MLRTLRAYARALALLLAGLVAAAPAARAADLAGVLGKLAPAATEAPEGEKPGAAKILAGFALTSGLKYAVGGVGPARLLPLLGGLGPAGGVAALAGLSMLEAAVSIFLFQKITGFQSDQRQFLAFLLASSAASLLTPLLLGPLGPLATTLVTNALRLVLFNLIARREGEALEIAGATVIAADPSIHIELPDLEPAPSADGDLAALHRAVQDRYDELRATEAQDPAAFANYAAAKSSLDAALRQAAAR